MGGYIDLLDVVLGGYEYFVVSVWGGSFWGF